MKLKKRKKKNVLLAKFNFAYKSAGTEREPNSGREIGFYPNIPPEYNTNTFFLPSLRANVDIIIIF